MVLATSPQRAAPRLAMVAGEASGDLLAGMLLAGLNKRWPGLRAGGIGGPRMREQGFDAWWPHDLLSVHGFSWELLRRYRQIVRTRDTLRARLLLQKPDVFLGVDAPDFNLALEADLRSAGIPTVHYVAPSVWAWRAERLETLRRSVDHVLCIFPFEPELLAQHGIASTYVGHPLARTIALQPDAAGARAQLGLAGDDAVVALLPGSRRAEIQHLAPRFLAAAALLRARSPQLRFVLPVAPGLRSLVETFAQRSDLGSALTLLDGQSHAALAACDVCLVASGTATLEAALFKRPMVIAYHMGWLSWQLMQRKRLQPWVGLPNILCREFVVPECLQDGASPAALAAQVQVWLEARTQAPEVLRTLSARFTELHHALLRDTEALACDAIQKIIQP